MHMYENKRGIRINQSMGLVIMAFVNENFT